MGALFSGEPLKWRYGQLHTYFANKIIDFGIIYMYIIDTNVRFDEEKAQKVLQKHGVNMEEIRQEIIAKRFDVHDVANQDGHPGQKMFVVLVNGYAHCVPFVIEQDGTIFLKTAFPSRVYQRRYENGNLRIDV
jgi:uncharacterized DUF497 family protein